jgi:CheY-like chemotaxis protein
MLLSTRSSLLLKAGYAVESVSSGDAALELLAKKSFDLVVVGRDSLGYTKQIDQQIREKYPTLPMLKIAEASDQQNSYATATSDSVPDHVLAAVGALLELTG